MSMHEAYGFRTTGNGAPQLGAGVSYKGTAVSARYVRVPDVTVAEGAPVMGRPSPDDKRTEGSHLHNAHLKDAHLCTVGKDGPSCYIVQNAVRVLGDVSLVAKELGITLSGVAQALNYADEYPHRPSPGDAELFEHAAAMLFADED
jgi:hypothetical protein